MSAQDGLLDRLPPIVYARHPRAKRLKLTVSRQGIRITIPPHCHERHITHFLVQHQDWIVTHWQHLQDLTTQNVLPKQLNLSYLTDSITIEYREIEQLFHMEQPDYLVINNAQPERALTAAIIAFAQQTLPEIVHNYATQRLLPVQGVRIATPRRRWGSCNHQRQIMLHAGLMLMPREFADYVVWHELAHTQHLNHQAEFWQLLEQFYPNAKQSQRAIKRFELPTWWTLK